MEAIRTAIYTSPMGLNGQFALARFGTRRLAFLDASRDYVNRHRQ
jgi:hypothetical protein